MMIEADADNADCTATPAAAPPVFIVEIATTASTMLLGEARGAFGEDTVLRFPTEEAAREAAIGQLDVIDEERDVDGSLAIVVAYGTEPSLRTVARTDRSPAYDRFMQTQRARVNALSEKEARRDA